MSYKLIVYTFVVTALWDVVLNYMSTNYEKLPNIVNRKMPFIKELRPYFQHHTILAAALIAGFVGATTQPIILALTSFPSSITNLGKISYFLLISFVISALYGFLMKWSGLFPHLQKYYYDYLGHIRGMWHDGVSGLIVQGTLLVMSQIINIVK